MRAPPNLGADYARAFEAIYPELAAKYGVLLYPFFLDGVAADAQLNQRDGIHPNAAGVDAIVDGILPKVEELVAPRRERVMTSVAAVVSNPLVSHDAAADRSFASA